MIDLNSSLNAPVNVNTAKPKQVNTQKASQNKEVKSKELSNIPLGYNGIVIKDNKEVYTLDTLKETLVDFELLETVDVPFVIKETSRKYQHTISQMSIWKKKA